MTWQKYSWDKEPSSVGLFFNPDINIGLAHANLIDHFVTDVQLAPTDFENLTSYKLLRNFLAYDLHQRWPDTVKIQFKIVAYKNSEKIEVFVSPWIEVENS